MSVSCVVLMGLLAGGLGIRSGIRHRHDGGETAHSHGAGAHSRSHSHSDGHSHSHSHSHSHASGHSHTHSHAHPEPHAHDVESETESEHVHPDGAHVHVTILGFELTLPDWFPGEPAPLYSEFSRDRSKVPAGVVVEIPGSYGLATFLQMFMDQLAIRPNRPLIQGPETPSAFAHQSPQGDLGLDAAPPLVPPPRFM